jgi:hypothetical protein
VSSGATTSLRKVALLDASKRWWRHRATARSTAMSQNVPLRRR